MFIPLAVAVLAIRLVLVGVGTSLSQTADLVFGLVALVLACLAAYPLVRQP